MNDGVLIYSENLLNKLRTMNLRNLIWRQIFRSKDSGVNDISIEVIKFFSDFFNRVLFINSQNFVVKQIYIIN